MRENFPAAFENSESRKAAPIVPLFLVQLQEYENRGALLIPLSPRDFVSHLYNNYELLQDRYHPPGLLSPVKLEGVVLQG